jgi:hypothetical protein
MSDEMSKLEGTLQRATMPQGTALPPGAEHQEAALRETWLAFGRLLEAAEAAAPPPRPLTLPFGEADHPVSAPRRAARSTVGSLAGSRRRLLATVSIVVAASLLVVAVTVRTSNRAGQKPATASVTVLPQKGPGVAAGTNGQTTPASKAVVVTQARAKPTVAPLADTHQAASTTKTAAWDDTFDTRIAQVGQQMALVEQNWQTRADSLDMVQYRLESVEQEVGQGKF